MYTITATLWLTAVAIISQTMAANTLAEEDEALLVITLQPETKSHVDNENYDVISTTKETEVNKENEEKYVQTTTTTATSTKSFSNTSTIIPSVTATTTTNTTTTNQDQQRNFMNIHSNNHKYYESFSKAKLNSEPNRKQIMKNAKQTERQQHTTNKGTNIKRNKIQQQHLLMPATAFLKTSNAVDPHIIIRTTALEKRVITTTNKRKTNITKTDTKILTPQWGILKKPIPLLTTKNTKAAYEQYKRKREIKQIKEPEKDPPMAGLKLQEIVTDAYKRMPTIDGAAVSINASLQRTLSSTASYNMDPGQIHINEYNRIEAKKLLNIPTNITANNLHSEEENLATLTRGNMTTTPNNHKRKNLMVNEDPAASIKSFNEFTKKLLAEEDGIINDIEQKFRLKEFVPTSLQTRSKTNIKQSTTATPFYNDIARLSTLSSASLLPKTTQQQTIKMNQGQHVRKPALNSDNNSRGKFIKKRAKKSFEFPVHSAGKDIVSVVKTTDKNEQIIYNPDTVHQTEIAQRYNEFSPVHNETKRLQPEFYTTKFFKSKLFHNKIHQYEKSQTKSIKKEKIANVSQINGSGNFNKNPPNLHNVTALHSQPLIKIIEHQHCSKDNRNCNITKVTLKTTLVPSITNEINQTTSVLIEPIKTMADHFNKTFELTKLNTETVNLNFNSTTIDNSPIDSITTTTHYTISEPTLPSTTVINNLSKVNSSSPLVNSMLFASNPAKSIARSNAVSRLQEKINLLECEVQNLPQGLQIWRSNETHELVLPIKTPQNCTDDVKCAAMTMSWQGESEIQSGDILIVQINDTLLSSQDSINTTDSAVYIKVYQVTRSGHEHCDVTEGILLDITPIILDDRKLVTLYDKDLTEGINLLIVVSELWDSQCVRLKVTTKSDNCGENADCSGKGVCYSTSALEEYECQCCSGFAGSRCEEIDACSPSPCTNNGICVDLSQGHEGNSYQCLCPYGYTGKNCQYELDSCNSAECMNGGSCIGNSTYFRCECLPGFSGPLCQHSLNECESLPCVHGICVDQEDGFRCFCQPGFAGELCNFEYNECDSNPCQNDGECIDHIGSYECHCTKGYIGNRCQTKVDFCALKPCPVGHRCVDHGNDYSCECQGGHNGLNCNQIQKTQCNVNPCTHGGTCWSSGDSFYCACRPGYTGTMCEDEFVVETVVSSSEFMVDDASARNFNDKSYGSTIILKSPLELHNAYVAAAVLAAAIFIVATVLTICHCKVNQTYRKFPTRTFGLLHLLGFGRHQQTQYKFNKHWLSGKGLNVSGREVGGNPLRSASSSSSATATTTKTSSICNHINNNNKKNNTYRQLTNVNVATATSSRSDILQNHPDDQLHGGTFQRTMENDMYYTIDFGEHTQHSPLIQ